MHWQQSGQLIREISLALEVDSSTRWKVLDISCPGSKLPSNDSILPMKYG